MSEITRGVTGVPFIIATDSDLAVRQLNAVEQGLKAENERLSLHSHCHLLRAQTVEVERDQLKAELEKVKADRKACWEEFKVQGRQLDQLKQENRLLTEHNEFLASSDSRLAPELRAVKDALGLDFTASVSCEVVPAIEKLRKLEPSKEIVWCGCGDGYPANSYGAGFMDANEGVCQNCDAAK